MKLKISAFAKKVLSLFLASLLLFIPLVFSVSAEGVSNRVTRTYTDVPYFFSDIELYRYSYPDTNLPVRAYSSQYYTINSAYDGVRCQFVPDVSETIGSEMVYKVNMKSKQLVEQFYQGDSFTFKMDIIFKLDESSPYFFNFTDPSFYFTPWEIRTYLNLKDAETGEPFYPNINNGDWPNDYTSYYWTIVEDNGLAIDHRDRRIFKASCNLSYTFDRDVIVEGGDFINIVFTNEHITGSYKYKNVNYFNFAYQNFEFSYTSSADNVLIDSISSIENTINNQWSQSITPQAPNTSAPDALEKMEAGMLDDASNRFDGFLPQFQNGFNALQVGTGLYASLSAMSIFVDNIIGTGFLSDFFIIIVPVSIFTFLVGIGATYFTRRYNDNVRSNSRSIRDENRKSYAYYKDNRSRNEEYRRRYRRGE